MSSPSLEVCKQSVHLCEGNTQRSAGLGHCAASFSSVSETYLPATWDWDRAIPDVRSPCTYQEGAPISPLLLKPVGEGLSVAYPQTTWGQGITLHLDLCRIPRQVAYFLHTPFWPVQALM